MIRVNRHLSLDENEVSFSYIRAGGPGGQNVNKVSSAAQLRFDAKASPSLPKTVRERLLALAATYLTKDGVIVITARRHRSQDMNREEALERLIGLIRRAGVVPKMRRPTRPHAAARRRRAEGKQRRAGVKRLRARVPGED